MKIVKYGHENTTLETIEVSCTGIGFGEKCGCGALLEVNGSDIRTNVHYDYGGGSDRYYYFVCPVCGVKTEIYSKNMPSQMIHMAK